MIEKPVAQTTDAERCPECAADFTGAPIPEAQRESFGGKTHFSRRIGLSDGDSVFAWRCPDCGHERLRGRRFAARAGRMGWRPPA